MGKSLWSPRFIRKYFSALMAKVSQDTNYRTQQRNEMFFINWMLYLELDRNVISTQIIILHSLFQRSRDSECSMVRPLFCGMSCGG